MGWIKDVRRNALQAAQTAAEESHVQNVMRRPCRRPPVFVDIGKMPSTTELSLKVFLRSSHKNMPNLILSADEVDALAAWILELGGKSRS